MCVWGDYWGCETLGRKDGLGHLANYVARLDLFDRHTRLHRRRSRSDLGWSMQIYGVMESFYRYCTYSGPAL